MGDLAEDKSDPAGLAKMHSLGLGTCRCLEPLAEVGFGVQHLLLELRKTGWAPVPAPTPPLTHCVPFAGAPGPPGVPIIVRYSSAIAIHWSSGDPGKGPITRYVIEARPSGMSRPA